MGEKHRQGPDTGNQTLLSIIMLAMMMMMNNSLMPMMSIVVRLKYTKSGKHR